MIWNNHKGLAHEIELNDELLTMINGGLGGQDGMAGLGGQDGMAGLGGQDGMAGLGGLGALTGQGGDANDDSSKPRGGLLGGLLGSLGGGGLL